AGREEPLERGQGPVLGAASHRARLRGEVRSPAGPSFPARGDVPALAARQIPGGLPLRSARGDAGLRAGDDLRRGAPPALTALGSTAGRPPVIARSDG